MPKHTPGPWKLEHGTYVHRGRWVVTAEGMPTSSPVVSISNHDDAAEYDGYLIAAAPEMLVALKEAETWLSGWASAEPQLSTIRAAISKAEGHQHDL